MKRVRDNQYFQLGLILLWVIVLSALAVVVMLNLSGILGVLAAIWKVLTPLIIGCVLAYLLNPLMNFANRILRPFLRKCGVKKEKIARRSKVLSMIFAFLFAGILAYEFFDMLLPSLVESVTGIVNNFQNYYAAVEGWITGFLKDNPVLNDQMNSLLSKAYEYLYNWINTGLLNTMNAFLTGLTSSVMSVVSAVMNIIVGIAAAVYILASRDLFKAQIKKVVVAFCKEETADSIFTLGRLIHKIFSGFIIGKILDSAIIGVLCYLGLLVLKMPYPALIATIIGVTNVIPFFGPLIGAVPCSLLILLVDPLKCLYFVLFVLALQQVDGNIIGPRILGDTIGISGFWVLVSITVAGGLFGFAGMVLGVPTFAVIYTILSDVVRKKLDQKNYPYYTATYERLRLVEDLKPREKE